MKKWEVDKMYRDKYHDAREDAKNPQNTSDEPRYSYRQLSALMQMAKHDTYPDDTFSDEECNIWELFTSMETIGEAKAKGVEVI